MGFTDYLSRNAHLSPSISLDDELFGINRMNEITIKLLNEKRKHKISTNKNTPCGGRRKSHDVMQQMQPAQNKENAF